MNQNNIFKKKNTNKFFFKKKPLLKKACKTDDLSHETRVNLQKEN